MLSVSRKNISKKEQIRRLISELGLRDIEDTMSLAEACGSEAIRPLREYVLYGKPDGIYQGRQYAILALAKLEAKEAIMEYLNYPKKDIGDPVTEFGEEAVESTAARELARWQTGDTFQFLIDYARKHKRIGALEALGEFKREEAAPLLIDALKDDYYRPAAESALSKLGQIAYHSLLRSATLIAESDREIPSVLRGSHTVLTLLANLAVSKKDWRLLRKLLFHSDAEIVSGAAQIAAKVAPKSDKTTAVRRIAAVYRSADWRIKIEMEDCLTQLLPELEVGPEIERLRQKPPKSR